MNLAAAATRLLVALVAVGATLSVVSPVADAETNRKIDVSVTWPTETAFNPNVHDYVVDIDYAGTDQIVIQDPDRHFRMDGLTGGRQAVAFDASGIFHLEVDLCHEGSCQLISRSPTLQLYAYLQIGGMPDWIGPATGEFGRVVPRTPADVVPPRFDVDWKVTPVDDPATVLTEGSASDVAAFPPLSATAGLVDGKEYDYVVHATVSGPLWGTIEATRSVGFRWDGTAPAITVQTGYHTSDGGRTTYVPSTLFYPIEDRRGDKLDIKATPDDTVSRYEYDVLDGDGRTVASRAVDTETSHGWQTFWDGTDDRGAIVPAGTYRLVVRAYDRAGNVGTIERSITVSAKHVQVVVFRRTYSPAKTQYDQLVGKCSRLQRPARPSWPGSIGYVSNTPCASQRGTSVATAHSVRLPWSNMKSYVSTRVSVTGGKATSARSYLAILYFTKGKGWDAPEYLDDNLGTHPGRTVDGSRTVLNVDERKPTLTWEVGLADGAKYDVKSFTVVVRYKAFK